MAPIRIVLGNKTLAGYPQGGGWWTTVLQYLLGLKALGHEVLLLELFWSTGDATRDHDLINSFFARCQQYGLKEHCILLRFDKDSDRDKHVLDSAKVYGRRRLEITDIIKNADLFWNIACGVRQPLLGLFRHRVLIDGDPGHLQVPAQTVDMDFYDHDTFLTNGRKMHDADCLVPTLGLKWHTFNHLVYLPMWNVAPDPGFEAPFTSITHWRWGNEQYYQGRLISTSKRDAYLKYIDLPQRTKRPFQLAANIGPEDKTGDRELLKKHGWELVDPWEVARSPAAYQHYIAGSRAEILCAKPIFTELKTGWFSDRSVCYLASGRPVLAEDTGFSDYFPTGKGLLAFQDPSEAIAGVAEIDANYAEHMRAARQFAEEFLDSRRCLEAMLAACGW